MKKSLLLISIFALTATLQAATPSWVRHTPKADNNTYRYVVESAVGTSEQIALNKAMGLVLQHAIMPLGLAVNSTQVENAIKTGKVESLVTEFKIPINKVCTYRVSNKSGGVRVYVLCQVAVAGNIAVQFTEFRNCGSAGDDKIDISMRPEEWGLYEMDSYFSASSEKELLKGEKEETLTKSTIRESEQLLLEDLGLRDSFLISAIQTKTYYDKANKICYAISFLEKEKVINQYSANVEEELDTQDALLKNAQSFLDENNIASAKALLERILISLNELEPKLNFIRAYATSRSAERDLQDCKDLKAQVKAASMLAAGGDSKALENKIREYVRNGMIALHKENKVGDALRYLFGAQVLLSDLPDNNTFTLKAPAPDGSMKDVIATTHISQQIKDILSGVQITCDGFLPGSTTEAKLSFLYDGKAVTNLNYIYNDNTGWSEENMPVKDGWTIVSLPAKNTPATLHIKIEYRYADEAAFDPELQTKMMKYGRNYNYDDDAKKIVLMNNNVVAELAPKPNVSNIAQPEIKAPAAANTSMTQNIVAEKVKQSRHLVSEEDSIQYREVIEKILDAIAGKDYQSAYTCFTEDGYTQFDKLARYGKARIICRTDYRFVKLGKYVMCRSIPMSFSFTKGKQAIENVVFTFDDNKKVDGIQFALEERSARNIMADTRYSETSQLTLINFMENYKTAFALKRLDYIESIFADDAVIITGRVLQKTEKADNNQLMLNNIVYTRQSKKEYIARLDNSFKSKEWINIKFGNTDFEKSAQGEQYGIRLLQDYASSNYGDRGYLFLLIDVEDQEKPLIRVRTWQPETAGSNPFSLSDYDELTAPKY